MIKVNELKKPHFQLYINHRSSQLGKQSNLPIKKQTIYRELYSFTSALKQIVPNFDSLENWQMPPIPTLPKAFKKKARRERLITETELKSVIDKLMEPPKGKQTLAHYFHRIRLAHQIEFQYWTGLRRKEICRLKFSQFDESQSSLLNVIRWKTDTVTKFFPLSKRAVEIIEARKTPQEGPEFIFSPSGEPIESNYRTLKNICKDLKISYGRFTDGGFVSHDLRHNFGTAILQETDIETARELLGHASVAQTGTYVHTSTDRLKEAIRKRDKINYDIELIEVYNEVKGDMLNEQEFTEKVKKIFGF